MSLPCLFPDVLSVSSCLVPVPDEGCASQRCVGSVVLTPDLRLARQGLCPVRCLPRPGLLQMEAHSGFDICLHPQGWFCFTWFSLLGGVSQNGFDICLLLLPPETERSSEPFQAFPFKISSASFSGLAIEFQTPESKEVCFLLRPPLFDLPSEPFSWV